MTQIALINADLPYFEDKRNPYSNISVVAETPLLHRAQRGVVEAVVAAALFYFGALHAAIFHRGDDHGGPLFSALAREGGVVGQYLVRHFERVDVGDPAAAAGACALTWT